MPNNFSCLSFPENTRKKCDQIEEKLLDDEIAYLNKGEERKYTLITKTKRGFKIGSDKAGFIEHSFERKNSAAIESLDKRLKVLHVVRIVAALAAVLSLIAGTLILGVPNLLSATLAPTLFAGTMCGMLAFTVIYLSSQIAYWSSIKTQGKLSDNYEITMKKLIKETLASKIKEFDNSQEKKFKCWPEIDPLSPRPSSISPSIVSSTSDSMTSSVFSSSPSVAVSSSSFSSSSSTSVTASTVSMTSSTSISSSLAAPSSSSSPFPSLSSPSLPAPVPKKPDRPKPPLPVRVLGPYRQEDYPWPKEIDKLPEMADANLSSAVLHVHGSEFGQGSQLQREGEKGQLPGFLQFIKGLSWKPAEELIEWLTGASSDEGVNYKTSMERLFDTGKPVLLRIAIRNQLKLDLERRGEHHLYLLAELEEGAETAKLSVFGLEEGSIRTTSEGIEHQSSYLQLSGISREKLTHPAFALALQEVQQRQGKLPRYSKATTLLDTTSYPMDVTREDLNAIFSMLEPTSQKRSSLHMPKQLGNTSAYSSLMGMVQYYFSLKVDLPNCDIIIKRIQVLYSRWLLNQMIKRVAHESMRSNNLFKKSLKEACRIVKVAQRQGLLSHEEFSDCQSHLEKMAYHHRSLLRAGHALTKGRTTTRSDFTPPRPLLSSQEYKSESSLLGSTSSFYKEKLREIATSELSSTVLENIFKVCASANTNDQCVELAYALEYLVEHLYTVHIKASSEWGKKTSQEEASKIMAHLETLGRFYYAALCRKKKRIRAVEISTMSALFTIQTRLSKTNLVKVPLSDEDQKTLLSGPIIWKDIFTREYSSYTPSMQSFKMAASADLDNIVIFKPDPHAVFKESDLSPSVSSMMNMTILMQYCLHATPQEIPPEILKSDTLKPVTITLEDRELRGFRRVIVTMNIPHQIEATSSLLAQDYGANQHVIYPKLWNERGYSLSWEYQDNQATLLAGELLPLVSSVEDGRRQLHFFGSPEMKWEDKILDCLGYINKWPDVLKDSDFQTRFRILLFSCPNIMKTSSSLQFFGNKLGKHLQKWMQRSAMLCNIQSFCFLLNTYRQAMEYFPGMDSIDTVRELRTMLKKENVFSSLDKSFLYAELLATLGRKNEIDGPDVIDLIVGKTWLKRYPLPLAKPNPLVPGGGFSSIIPPLVQYDMERAFIVHAQKIQDYLLRPSKNKGSQKIMQGHKNIALLMEKIGELLEWPSSRMEWDVKQEKRGDCRGILITSREGSPPLYTFDPIACTFVALDRKQTVLPHEIGKNPEFIKLFPNVTKAHQTLSPSGIVYCFEDSDRNQCAVQWHAGELIIQRTVRSEVWCYISDTKLIGFLSNYSPALLHQHIHWWNPQTEELYCCDRTGAVKYVVKPSTYGIDSIWKGLPSDGIRMLQGAYHQDTLNLLKMFDSEPYIHIWGTSNALDQATAEIRAKLDSIELVRFGLRFTGRELESQQFPGYKIAKKNKAVDAILGSFHNYLVLQSGEKIKVLIPKRKASPASSSESLEALFVWDEEDHQMSQQFCVYDLTSSGELVSLNDLDNLYFAKIFTLTQQYDLAARYLKKYGHCLGSLSSKQEELLLEIFHLSKATKDRDSNYLAMQVYIGYLLITYGQPSKETLSQLETFCMDYFSRHDRGAVLKLSQFEVFTIFRALHRNNMIVPPLWEKLSKLEEWGSGTIAVEPDEKEVKDKSEVEEAELEFLLRMGPGGGRRSEVLPTLSMIEHHVKEFWTDSFNRPFNIPEEQLITRPNKVVRYYFAAYCRLLIQAGRKESKEEAEDGRAAMKEWILQALPFLKQSRDMHCVAVVFECIHRYPESFVNIPESELNSSEGFKSILSIVRTLVSNIHFASLPDIEEPKKPELPASFASDEDVIPSAMPVALESLGHKKFAYLSPCPKTVATLARLEGMESKEKESEFKTGREHFQLREIISNASAVGPVGKQLQEELLEDAVKWERQCKVAKASATPRDEGWITELETELKSTKSELQKTMKELQVMLIDLVNEANVFLNNNEEESKGISESERKTQVDRELRVLERIRGRSLLTLEDLIGAFCRGMDTLLATHPYLKDNINILQNEVGEFLVIATRLQQLENIEKMLKEMQASSGDERTQLKGQLVALILKKREFSLENTPTGSLERVQELSRRHRVLLVNEFMNGFLLRQDQVEGIHAMLDNPGTVVHKMKGFEMIMGSGKSKVLMVLLAMLNPTETRLCSLVVPSTLLRSIADNTYASLRKYGTQLHELSFERNSSTDSFSLRVMLKNLKHWRANREPVIMSDKTLHTLVLKFNELLQVENYNPENRQRVNVMREIINLVLEGRLVVDELHLVANVLHLLAFSEGEKKPINEEEILITSKLYEQIYTNEALKKLARIDSDPSPDPRAPQLTPDNYDAIFRRPLAEAFLKDLMNEKEKTGLREKMLPFLERLGRSSEDRELTLAYLCGGENQLEAAQKFFDSLPENVQDVLAYAGKQITIWLKYTLCERRGIKYGPHPNIRETAMAIPFSAAATPLPSSRFASEAVSLNFTFQLFQAVGVPLSLVQVISSSLRSKLSRRDGDLGGDLSSSSSSLTLIHEKTPILPSDSRQIEAETGEINKSFHTKDAFLKTHVFSGMTYYPRQISSNPMTLCGMSSKGGVGFTATLSSIKNSLHREVDPQFQTGAAIRMHLALLKKGTKIVVAGEHVEKENKEREGKVKKEEESKVKASATSTRQAALNAIIRRNMPTGSYDLIIDASGEFEGYDNRDVAECLLELYGKAVVFFDASGAEVILTSIGREPMPFSHYTGKAEDRVTFLDQNNSVGADIPQASNAKANLIVGKDMTLTAFNQAVGRLRKIEQGQTLVITLSKDAAALIRQTQGMADSEPLTYSHLFNLLFRNECLQRGNLNYQGSLQQMRSLLQVHLMNACRDSEVVNKLTKEQYDKLKSGIDRLWSQSETAPNRIKYGRLNKLCSSEFVLDHEHENHRKELEAAAKEFSFLDTLGYALKPLFEELDKIIEAAKKVMPERLLLGTKDDKMDKSQETQAQIQSQLQLQVRPIPPLRSIGTLRAPGFANKCEMPTVVPDANCCMPIFKLTEYLSGHKDHILKKCAPAFSQIDIMLDMLTREPGKVPLSDCQLFGEPRIPISHMVVQQKGDYAGRCLLLNQWGVHTIRDSEWRSQYLKKGYMEFVFSSNLYHITEASVQKPLPSMEGIIQAKFLAGTLSFPKEEQEFLKTWLRSQDIEAMERMMVEYILKDQKERAEYEGTILHKIFEELKKEKGSSSSR